jgi:hypothetical protein
MWPEGDQEFRKQREGGRGRGEERRGEAIPSDMVASSDTIKGTTAFWALRRRCFDKMDGSLLVGILGPPFIHLKRVKLNF